MSEARAYTPKVTVVPATRNRFTAAPIAAVQRRRVAAYARVSTDSEEQLTSYRAQVDYYTQHIQARPDWQFVNVYTDKGITGTSIRKREGFNQMIRDALDGKIDLIITKSVSRFARNTVDTLTTIRELKKHGIEVYFEEQNIYTLDSKGELLLTIMSSVAQEESRSISENVTWGQRKRFADGKVSMPYKHFLGYQRGENGEPEIVEEEARIVRRIYRLFLDGKTPIGIAKILTDEGMPTPTGKQKWSASTILSILTNEKYKGDALLQKTFCTDFLTKKMKVNEGEVPQYYVENSHPAIIDREAFDLTQQELERRKLVGRQHNGTGLFSGKLYCGCCGGLYGSKVWHSNTKYRRVIWRCNAKYKNDEKCDTPHLTEEEIQQAFVIAMNRLLEGRRFIIHDCQTLMKTLTDTAALEAEQNEMLDEMNVVNELLRKLIGQNATEAMDQDEYNRRFNLLEERHQRAKMRKEVIDVEIQQKKALHDRLNQFIRDVKKQPDAVTEFSPEAWIALAESATVSSNGMITFTFRNGQKITIENPR